MATEPDSANDVILVLSTCPANQAESIARTLVEEKLAACVNIAPQVLSVYRWQGRIETSTEALLLLKCSTEHVAALQQRLQAIHPYELPEIITVPLSGGLQTYLDWVKNPDTTAPENGA